MRRLILIVLMPISIVLGALGGGNANNNNGNPPTVPNTPLVLTKSELLLNLYNAVQPICRRLFYDLPPRTLEWEYFINAHLPNFQTYQEFCAPSIAQLNQQLNQQIEQCVVQIENNQSAITQLNALIATLQQQYSAQYPNGNWQQILNQIQQANSTKQQLNLQITQLNAEILNLQQQLANIHNTPLQLKYVQSLLDYSEVWEQLPYPTDCVPRLHIPGKLTVCLWGTPSVRLNGRNTDKVAFFALNPYTLQRTQTFGVVNYADHSFPIFAADITAADTDVLCMLRFNRAKRTTSPIFAIATVADIISSPCGSGVAQLTVTQKTFSGADPMYVPQMGSIDYVGAYQGSNRRHVLSASPQSRVLTYSGSSSSEVYLALWGYQHFSAGNPIVTMYVVKHNATAEPPNRPHWLTYFTNL